MADPRWKERLDALETDERMQKLRKELAKKNEPMARPNPTWRTPDPATDDLPVFEVTGLEAHLFAQLLGGALPSGEEWGKAGGDLDNQPGPFLKPFVVPERKGPVPCDWDERDQSIYKVRGMAATGREFTRDVIENGVKLLFPNQVLGRWHHELSLRGAPLYDANAPYHFRETHRGHTNVLRYWDWSPDVGFRVVVTPPAN